MFPKESVKIAGQMFSIESAMVKKTLLKWLNIKIRRRIFEKINPVDKLRFEILHPINWKKDKCVICKFPMKMEPANYLTPDNETPKSDHIKNLQSYYEIFQEYIQICIGLLALVNNFERNNYLNCATEEFVEIQFAGDDLRDIKNAINQTEIKNTLSMTKGNVSKFNLKVFVYVYNQLFDFPPSENSYEVITTNNFFSNVNRLIRGEFHLHHSHITGIIAHDFCNTAYFEKAANEIPFIGHNFFGFDLFYWIKTCIASAWCSKELNIAGNNLTHANFGNINNEIKLIDSLKFCQQSLCELSSTLTEQEKIAVKSLAEKFLNEHYYFSTV